MNKTIYFGDKKILIRNKEKYVPSKPEQYLDFDNLTIEYHTRIHDFLEGGDKKLIILSKNTSEAYKAFKKNFRFILAAGGLIKNNSHFLIIKRLGKWDLPKGKLGHGESPELGAIRECTEECGIKKLQISNKLKSTLHIYKQDDKYILKKTYWFEMLTNYEGELIPQAEENIEEAVWMTKDEILDKVYSNTFPAIKQLLKKYFKKSS